MKPVTVREWANQWSTYYPGRRSPETERHNEQMTAPFVRKHGSKLLSEVPVLLAQEWANRNPGHVRYLRLMFGKAVKAELLERNVWDNVEVVHTSKGRRCPAPDELARIVTAARSLYSDHYADMILVTAYSGIRLSEVAALRVSDVVSPSRIRVWDEKKDRFFTVAVFGPGREALARSVRRRTQGMAVVTDRGGLLTGRLLWVSPQRQQFNRASLGRVYRRVCDEAGVTDTTFHGLRHFCATWLLDQGATDQDVSIQLGHVDDLGRVNADLVRTTYGHPTIEAALGRLDALTTGEGSIDGGGGPAAGPHGVEGAHRDGSAGPRHLRGPLRAVGAQEPESAGPAAALDAPEAGGARA